MCKAYSSVVLHCAVRALQRHVREGIPSHDSVLYHVDVSLSIYG